MKPPGRSERRRRRSRRRKRGVRYRRLDTAAQFFFWGQPMLLLLLLRCLPSSVNISLLVHTIRTIIYEMCVQCTGKGRRTAVALLHSLLFALGDGLGIVAHAHRSALPDLASLRASLAARESGASSKQRRPRPSKGNEGGRAHRSNKYAVDGGW